jgi:predicted nucleotidyltransferase
MDERIIDVAKEIRAERYGTAAAVFAAGSIVRGGAPFSDLDLVVVFAQLPCAYRESFRSGG